MTTSNHRPWLLRAPTDTARILLFCFPYSGCGASIYRRWPRTVGSVEVCPVQLPGRENRIREQHFGTLELLADALSVGLAPFLDRPYMFFGHCAGALQAYECALRMADKGLPSPSRVFLSSQPPPHEGAGQNRFATMSEPELRAELRHLVAAMGGTPTEELLELYLSLYRPDLNAVRSYHKSTPAPLAAPITVISWDDSGLPLERLAGWSAYGNVTYESVAGGHYDFLEAPAALLNIFQPCAPQVQADRRP